MKSNLIALRGILSRGMRTKPDNIVPARYRKRTAKESKQRIAAAKAKREMRSVKLRIWQARMKFVRDFQYGRFATRRHVFEALVSMRLMGTPDLSADDVDADFQRLQIQRSHERMIADCRATGVPCSDASIEWFGYVID